MQKALSVLQSFRQFSQPLRVTRGGHTRWYSNQFAAPGFESCVCT